MALIDEKFMEEVGLGNMPPVEKQAFMEQATEELELRVGQEISAGLTSEQLNEFERIQNTDAVASWLDRNVPNFREVVLMVFLRFKNEVLASQQQILA